MIRVMVVDDHPVVRDGLMAIVELQDDMDLVGEAGDGPSAVALAREVQPDVILMDLQIPGFTGAEALRQIKAESPDTQVLILTAYNSDDTVLDAIRAGASGYLLKGARRDELVKAIRLVADGGSLIQPAMVARLMNQVRDPDPAHEHLTEREQQVLKLMVDGLRNKEISDQLGIVERTVKFHVGIIFQKLGVSSRSEAVAVALKRKLVS